MCRYNKFQAALVAGAGGTPTNPRHVRVQQTLRLDANVEGIDQDHHGDENVEPLHGISVSNTLAQYVHPSFLQDGLTDLGDYSNFKGQWLRFGSDAFALGKDIADLRSTSIQCGEDVGMPA